MLCSGMNHMCNVVHAFFLKYAKHTKKTYKNIEIYKK